MSKRELWVVEQQYGVARTKGNLWSPSRICAYSQKRHADNRAAKMPGSRVVRYVPDTTSEPRPPIILGCAICGLPYSEGNCTC